MVQIVNNYLYKVVVEAGGYCLVHRVLVLVGRGSVHGVHSVHNWVNPYLLKFLVLSFVVSCITEGTLTALLVVLVGLLW